MSKYNILAKRTQDLAAQEWRDIITAFNSVFKKEYSKEYFNLKYLNSALGHSYHGLLYSNKTVVGIFSVIPRKYKYIDKDLTIGLACDAFILKEHRKDEFFLKQMADAAIAELKKADVTHFISIPNKTAYPYWKYFGGWKDIGKLDYYLIPIRISKLLGKYSFLDIISAFIFKILIKGYKFFNLSETVTCSSIRLNRNEDYLRQRFPSDYEIRTSNNITFVYRIYDEDNIQTAYLIDCYPKSQKNIARALNQIREEASCKLDVILYVGKIENPPFFFIKVPKKREPRVQPFIGLSIDNFFPDFFDINSWDVSLADFDNR